MSSEADLLALMRADRQVQNRRRAAQLLTSGSARIASKIILPFRTAWTSSKCDRGTSSPKPLGASSPFLVGRFRFFDPIPNKQELTEHHLFGSSRLARSKSAVASSYSPLRCKVMPRLI